MSNFNQQLTTITVVAANGSALETPSIVPITAITPISNQMSIPVITQQRSTTRQMSTQMTISNLGTAIPTTTVRGTQMAQLTLPNAKIIPGTGGQPPKITFTPIDPANISQINQNGNRIVVLVPVSSAGGQVTGKPAISFNTNSFSQSNIFAKNGTNNITFTSGNAGVQQPAIKQSVMLPFISKLPAGTITQLNGAPISQSGGATILQQGVVNNTVSGLNSMVNTVTSKTILSGTNTGASVQQNTQTSSTATSIIANGTTFVITSGNAPNSTEGIFKLTTTPNSQLPSVVSSNGTTFFQCLTPVTTTLVTQPTLGEKLISTPDKGVTVPPKITSSTATATSAFSLVKPSTQLKIKPTSPIVVSSPFSVFGQPSQITLLPPTVATTSPIISVSTTKNSSTTLVKKGAVANSQQPETKPKIIFKQTDKMSPAFKQILASTKPGTAFTIPVAMAPQAIVAQLTRKVGKKASNVVDASTNTTASDCRVNFKGTSKKTPTVTVVPNPEPTFRPINSNFNSCLKEETSSIKKITFPKKNTRNVNSRSAKTRSSNKKSLNHSLKISTTVPTSVNLSSPTISQPLILSNNQTNTTSPTNVSLPMNSLSPTSTDLSGAPISVRAKTLMTTRNRNANDNNIFSQQIASLMATLNCSKPYRVQLTSLSSDTTANSSDETNTVTSTSNALSSSTVKDSTIFNHIFNHENRTPPMTSNSAFSPLFDSSVQTSTVQNISCPPSAVVPQTVPKSCISYGVNPPKRMKIADLPKTNVSLSKAPKEDKLSRAVKYYMKEVYGKDVVF